MELKQDHIQADKEATDAVAQLPFLFVGGAKRSGTTLVQRIMTAHSEITGGPEFNFTLDIFQLYRKMLKGVDNNGQDYFFDKEKLDASMGIFYESFFKEPFAAAGTKYFSEKTPSNIFVAQQFLYFFPQAKYVNIIRDGRDVLLSHMEVKKRYTKEGYAKHLLKPFKVGRVCRDWNLAVDAWVALEKRDVYKGRVFNLMYHELILNPEENLKKLFEFLELPFEPHLLEPEKIDNAATMINNRWHVQKTHFQTWNPDKIGKWKKGLTLRQKFLGNLYMARNLNQMGFAISGFFKMMHGLKKLLPHGIKRRLTS